MSDQIIEVEPGVYSIIAGDRVLEARVDGETVTIAGHPYRISPNDRRKYQRRGPGLLRAGQTSVKAPMPGRVVNTLVKIGDPVDANQGIVVIEAMKMQNELKSATAGQVSSLRVKNGDMVSAGDILAVIE